mgnify:CR=1 FL=1
MLAVIIFVIGSILVSSGAVIDLIVIARGQYIVHALSAPQAREMTMPRWPTRPAPSTPRGAFARVTKGGTCKVGAAQAVPPQRRYRVMLDEGQSPPTPGEVELASCAARAGAPGASPSGAGDAFDAPPPASPQPLPPESSDEAAGAVAVADSGTGGAVEDRTLDVGERV